MKRVINYGKHDATGNGRRLNEVELEVNIEKTVYYDPETQRRIEKGSHFSVCAQIWNARRTDLIMAGQCVDKITEKYGKDNTGRNIRALWEVFHLSQMERIPERFRTAIEGFVDNKADEMVLERKKIVSHKLRVKELCTDYGAFTEGAVTVKTEDGLTEVIELRQGDEKKFPIADRANTALSWLYSNVPTAEMLCKTAAIKSNGKRYAASKVREKVRKVAEIRNLAQGIVHLVQKDKLGPHWDMVHHTMKQAEMWINKK